MAYPSPGMTKCNNYFLETALQNLPAAMMKYPVAYALIYTRFAAFSSRKFSDYPFVPGRALENEANVSNDISNSYDEYLKETVVYSRNRTGLISRLARQLYAGQPPWRFCFAGTASTCPVQAPPAIR
jgi:hypothetical protein